MINDVEIANAALNLVGANSLTSLADATEHARIVNRYFNHTRDATLRHYTWNFALRRQSLSKDAAGPAFEFTNSFSLPTDPYCLRALEMYNDTNEWRIEGRKLLTDSGNVNLKYIARIVSAVEFDDLFTEAMIYRLASNIAFPVMRDKVLARDLYAVYLEKVQIARSTDSQEGSQNAIISDALTAVRRVGTLIPPTTPVSSAGTPR